MHYSISKNNVLSILLVSIVTLGTGMVCKAFTEKYKLWKIAEPL